MAKKKIKLVELGKTHTKEHLRMVHPFLRKDYRVLKMEELDSDDTFIDLFGNVKIEHWKLKAIYEYQK